MSLTTPEKLQRLQRSLYAKAKQEPEGRFHFLYDKVYREDLLQHAYAQSRSNRGAPGVDGQTFADVEAYGEEKWLAELKEELQAERYRPQAVRRVMIPKASGVGERPLGIPTIPHVRFDERAGETERWTTRRRAQRKTRPASGAAGPARHRAPARLYWY